MYATAKNRVTPAGMLSGHPDRVYRGKAGNKRRTGLPSEGGRFSFCAGNPVFTNGPVFDMISIVQTQNKDTTAEEMKHE